MSDSEQQLWGFSAPPSPDDDSGVQGEIDDLLLEELFLKPSHDPSGDGKVEVETAPALIILPR